MHSSDHHRHVRHGQTPRTSSGRHTARLFACLMMVLGLAIPSLASADIFSFLAKAGKAGGAAARPVTRIALSRTDAMKLAALAGAGAVYVEMAGGRLVLRTLDGRAGELAGTGDDLLGLAARSSTQSAGAARFVLTRESADALGSRIQELAATREVYVVDGALRRPLRLVVQQTDGGAVMFKQIGPGLLTRFETELAPELAGILDQPAPLERLLVGSMFARSDVDSLRLLAAAAGDRLLDDAALMKAIRNGSLEPFRGKTVILVGHVENGAFVARNANGAAAFSADIRTLEAMADAANVTLVGAGCSSAFAGARAGFPVRITDADAAEGVRRALQASTLGDMLGAFGHRHPLILSEDALRMEGGRMTLALSQDLRFSKPVNGSALTLRVSRPFAAAAEPLLERIAGCYIVGFIGLLCMFRSNRDAFLRSYPVLPSPAIRSQQPGYLVRLLWRELVFFLLSPFFMMAVLVAIFMGGWAHRRTMLNFLWTFIRTPLQSTVRLLFALVSMFALLAAYVTVAGVLLSLFIALASLAAGIGAPWNIAAWAVVLAYLYAAWRIGWKLHKLLHAWLSAPAGESSDVHAPKANA